MLPQEYVCVELVRPLDCVSCLDRRGVVAPGPPNTAIIGDSARNERCCCSCCCCCLQTGLDLVQQELSSQAQGIRRSCEISEMIRKDSVAHRVEQPLRGAIFFGFEVPQSGAERFFSSEISRGGAERFIRGQMSLGAIIFFHLMERFIRSTLSLRFGYSVALNRSKLRPCGRCTVNKKAKPHGCP